jgi:hypothetical protein
MANKGFKELKKVEIPLTSKVATHSLAMRIIKAD